MECFDFGCVSRVRAADARKPVKGPAAHSGQGMSEYLIVVALIAVCCIGVFAFFGDTLQRQTGGISQELAGQSGQTDQANSIGSADDASLWAERANNLEDYYDNGQGNGIP